MTTSVVHKLQGQSCTFARLVHVHVHVHVPTYNVLKGAATLNTTPTACYVINTHMLAPAMQSHGHTSPLIFFWKQLQVAGGQNPISKFAFLSCFVPQKITLSLTSV